MLKKTLKRLVDEAWELSSQAQNVLGYIYDYFDEDEVIDEDNIYDIIPENVDSELTYYHESFSYLQDNQITDYRDAVRYAGADSISTIACYYLEEEVRDYISEHFSEYEAEEDEGDLYEEDEED